MTLFISPRLWERNRVTVLVKLTRDPNNSLWDRREFFNSRSPPDLNFFFSIVVPSCSRLAPLPAPVHYVVRVRVRERCSRLSCIQSGLPTGHLDVFPDRGRPSRTSDRCQGDGTCPAGSGASIDNWVFYNTFSTSGSTTSSSLSIHIAAACSHLLYTYVYISL